MQLEISRCLLVHGGLEALLKKIAIEFDQRGFSVFAGVGPSRESAWLLSQFNRASVASIADQGLPLESQLSPIPLSYLDEFPKDTAALAKAGIRTFKELLTLPSTSVKQRCSHDFPRGLTGSYAGLKSLWRFSTRPGIQRYCLARLRIKK